MAEQPIFRQVALDRMASPDRLDALMQVTSPRSWMALAGVAVLIVATLVWGFVGSIPIELRSPALIINAGGVQNVAAPATGHVTTVGVTPGDFVARGAVLATLTDANGRVIEVGAPYDGRVVEVTAVNGAPVGAGTPLLRLERTGAGVAREAIMYVNSAAGADLEPGMQVQLLPNGGDSATTLAGEITYVGRFPATQSGIAAALGTHELAQALGVGPVSVEVRVRLADPSAVESGTLAAATIVLDEQRPIEMVLPVR